jgi:hypothetical protein
MNISKWTLTMRNKLKLTLAMALAAGLLFIANAFEKRQMTSMDQSFLSIYEDRLVPAVSFFEIRELLYRKRELMQQALQPAQETPTNWKNGIDSCNREIGVLLAAYKKTYFTGNESECLKAFETSLMHYDAAENKALSSVNAGNAAAAVQGYERAGSPSFKSAILKLSELNHLQTEIGKGMLSDSRKTLSGFLVLSNLETALIVLFGLLAHLILHATRKAKRRIEPFNMN